MSENQSNSSYSKGFLFGVVIGGAIGAITALLLAPKSGKELRKDLAQKSGELYEKAADYLSNIEGSVGNAVNTTVNEGREKAQNIIRSAKKQAEVLLDNAEQILQEAREKASQTKENIQSKLENLKDAAKAGAEAFRSEMKSVEE